MAKGKTHQFSPGAGEPLHFLKNFDICWEIPKSIFLSNWGAHSDYPDHVKIGMLIKISLTGATLSAEYLLKYGNIYDQVSIGPFPQTKKKITSNGVLGNLNFIDNIHAQSMTNDQVADNMVLVFFGRQDLEQLAGISVDNLYFSVATFYLHKSACYSDINTSPYFTLKAEAKRLPTSQARLTEEDQTPVIILGHPCPPIWENEFGTMVSYFAFVQKVSQGVQE